MKIKCIELNKYFENEKEMLKALAENIDDIIAIKKSAVKFSDPTGLQILSKPSDESLKGMLTPKAIEYGDIVYPVINTTNLLDSHGDVHIPGLWKKSIKEQKNKVFLIINHDLEVGKVIAQPKDVEAFTKNLNWADLGAEYEGETEALIFGSKLTERSNKDGFNAYKYGDPVQHSIRMIYDKIYFCVNPEKENSADFAAYNDNWEKYINEVANIEDAKNRGYFWAVTEARIFKEGSMVLFGSNSVTPTIYDLEGKSSTDTSNKHEPPKSTQNEDENKNLQNRKKYLLNL